MRPGWKNRMDERRYFDELKLKQSQANIERAKLRVEMEVAKLELRLSSDRSRYIAVVKETDQ